MTTYIGRHYKLRAGSPMPTTTEGHFVLQTFLAATQDDIIDSCTSVIPKSNEFTGQGGNYQSASFSRLPVSDNGVELFRGKITEQDLFGEEDSWGFNN